MDERFYEIKRMVILGMTFQEIADKIGMTRQGVHEIYKKGLKEEKNG